MDRADSNVQKMREDTLSDWPSRLMHDLHRAPLVTEAAIDTLGYRAATRNENLTTPELRVLECVSRGMTSEQAAEVLFLGYDTVREHLKMARYKLRAKNTTHACCEAIRQGVIR